MEPATGFVFVGNQFIVDFVNTRKNVKGVRTELLHHFNDLLKWLELAGKLRLVTGHSEHLPPETQAEMLSGLRVFRDHLEEVFVAITQGEMIPDSFLEELNRRLASSDAGHYYLDPASRELERHYSIMQLPALVLDEAALFFHSLKPHNLRKCENGACILYFYDTSRNQKRRWCSMEKCGNRIKVNQHYHRRRKLPADE